MRPRFSHCPFRAGQPQWARRCRHTASLSLSSFPDHASFHLRPPSRHTAAVARHAGAVRLIVGHHTGVLAQNTDASDPNSPALSEVQVRETSGSSGYQGAQLNTAATRTDTPLETPQAVRVVPQQLIEDLGARRLADTVDFVSGITRLNDFGGTWDNFAIRGFSNTDGGSLLNGFASGRGYGPQRDVASVERVEFLKGPLRRCTAAASQAAPSTW